MSRTIDENIIFQVNPKFTLTVPVTIAILKVVFPCTQIYIQWFQIKMTLTMPAVNVINDSNN